MDVAMRDDSTDLQNDLGIALLDSEAEAILACDREGIIRYWNPGAVRIFGFDANEALGQSLDIIIPERLRARHWTGYHDVMRSGQSRYGKGDVLSVPGLRKDQSQVSIEFTITPVHDKQGRLWGLAAVIRDVTARFEDMKALRRQLRTQAGAVEVP